MSTDETGSLISKMSRSQTISHKHNDVVSHCLDDTTNLWRLWTICLVLGLGNMADAIEITCIGYILSDIENISSTDQEFLSSSVFIGMLVGNNIILNTIIDCIRINVPFCINEGGIACGFLSDIVGRRPMLLLSLAVNTIFGTLSAFSWNIPSLIVFRVIAGLGVLHTPFIYVIIHVLLIIIC